MKTLLILLSLCIVFISCSNMQKPLMKVVSQPVESEKPFGDVPRITVSDAMTQDKITGPYLWMIAPNGYGRGGPESIDFDLLAYVSDGVVTETAVATNGVAEGDSVGDLTWTLGTISGVTNRGYSNNLNDVINATGLRSGHLIYLSSYALINIVSDTDRANLTMRVGSDDSIKVWLNGEVVHINPVHRGAVDFQESFGVDLNKGNNLLLVKVSQGEGPWAMFVGITEEITEAALIDGEAAE